MTVLTELLPLIGWDHHIEKQSRTIVHQIVCGLSGRCLDLELRGSTAINKLDRNGRSSLWYAVRHRRLDYVRSLLLHGADPNIGEPPLWAATAGKGHYVITELLLDHGASLDPTLSPASANGWLPWAFAGIDKSLVKFDKLLLRHRIDIKHGAQWRDTKDVTILMRLTSMSSFVSTPLRMEQLISLGADVDARDKEGKTAIMYAVSGAYARAFHVLARSGARLDLKTVTGNTILHLVITQTTSHGTTPNAYSICNAICNEDVDCLDLEAKDEDGNTAYDLLRIRYSKRWDAYSKFRGKTTLDTALRDQKYELAAIHAIEQLLLYVQESQGIPEGPILTSR